MSIYPGMESLGDEATSLEGTHQSLLFQGAMQMKRGWRRKERHLFLFNDFLVVSNSMNKPNFKIKHVIPLSDLWLDHRVDTSGENHCRGSKSIFLGWTGEGFLATFCTVEEKEQWQFLLRRHSKEAKEKDSKKNIRLQIFTEDIPSCAGPLYVTAKNSDTITDIIKKLIPMLGLPSAQKENDYQLWFASGQKQAPYKLQRKAHPYDIKMNNIRRAALGPKGPKNCTSFSTIKGSYVEQMSPDIQGWFILKPSDVDRGQWNKKTFKRRWPFMNHGYQQMSYCNDTECTLPADENTGKLFGKLLSDVCEDGKLPIPIEDMLTFLNEKGPFTKGVFKKAANIKSCNALKEKLDSGKRLNLNNESVLDVASVLKDFLKNIEGSVLTSSLYDQWLGVLDESIDAKRISKIKSILKQLPKSNVVLLKSLFELLKNIESRSSTNHMTAYKLSVHLAPSILCLPTSGKTNLEKELSKKTFLIQFILENSQKIFGKDLSSLWARSSVNCNDSEKTPRKLDISTSFVEEAANDDGSCDSKRTCPEVKIQQHPDAHP